MRFLHYNKIRTTLFIQTGPGNHDKMCVWAQILCASNIFGTQHDALKIFLKFENYKVWVPPKLKNKFCRREPLREAFEKNWIRSIKFNEIDVLMIYKINSEHHWTWMNRIRLNFRQVKFSIISQISKIKKFENRVENFR